MYHVLIDTPTNPMSESITDVNNQGKNKDSIAPYVLISGAYRSVAKVNVDGTFQIELPAGKYKLAVPGLYLNTDNAAHAAKVYEITIDADKPVTDVEIPPKKIEPAPKPAPAPEQPRTGPFEPPPAP